MKILVSELRSNPFRNVANYPTDQSKIDALKESIRTTSFWDNLLARPAPDGNGYEQAYGEHRKRALVAMGIKEIDIPVRDLDNTAMARIMAHENMEEWGHSAAIEQETIRAIIEAYGTGQIDLPKPKAKVSRWALRYAPLSSARAGDITDYPYTVATLAEFLGWKSYKVEGALSALELIEGDVADSDDFKDLSSRQAEEVAKIGKSILHDKQEADPKKSARTVVKGLAAGMRKSVGKGSRKANKGRSPVTIHNAKREANRMLGRDIRKAVGDKPKSAPDIDTYAMDTAKLYGRAFSDSEPKMREIIKYRDYLSTDSHRVLVASLQRVIKDATKHLVTLDPDALKEVMSDMRTGGALLQLGR